MSFCRTKKHVSFCTGCFKSVVKFARGDYFFRLGSNSSKFIFVGAQIKRGKIVVVQSFVKIGSTLFWNGLNIYAHRYRHVRFVDRDSAIMLGYLGKPSTSCCFFVVQSIAFLPFFHCHQLDSLEIYFVEELKNDSILICSKKAYLGEHLGREIGWSKAPEIEGFFCQLLGGITSLIPTPYVLKRGE